MYDSEDYLLEQCSNPYNYPYNLMGLTSFEACKIDAIQNFLLQDAIIKLSPTHPFLSFDLGFTEDDIYALTHLHIGSKGEYENFAELQNLTDELTIFFKSLSSKNDNISAHVAKIINQVVDNILLSSKQGDTAWVVVKASLTTEEFDLPDWHTDPCLSNMDMIDLICKNNEHYGVFVIKGVSTTFYPLPDEKREEFNFKFNIKNYSGNETHTPLIKVDNPSSDLELQKRQELAKMLNISNTISIEFGQGYVFLAGKEYGAVHTTPPIHEERVFIAVYPSDKPTIKRLEDRMKTVNPNK